MFFVLRPSSSSSAVVIGPDFVSPFSYISLCRLKELPGEVSYKPVLFAGLLKHWGQKGPAEIPAKRRWTYRWCTWWARDERRHSGAVGRQIIGSPMERRARSRRRAEASECERRRQPDASQ